LDTTLRVGRSFDDATRMKFRDIVNS